MILSTAHAFGIDVSKVKVSTSTLFRHRKETRSKISNDIRETFDKNIEESFFQFHWDGAMLPKWLSVDGKSDKLAIVISNGKMTKLLAAEDLPNSRSVTQYDAIV